MINSRRKEEGILDTLFSADRYRDAVRGKEKGETRVTKAKEEGIF